MGAGDSARREYERRASRDRTARRRALPVAAGLALVLGVAAYLIGERVLPGLGWIFALVTVVKIGDELLPRQSTIAWRRGAEGEEAVGRVLDKLSGDSVFVLHDRQMPGSRANIDHLVFSPAGVFTVDAKKYKGRLRVRRGKLTVDGRDRTKLIEQAKRQARVLEQAVSEAAGLSVPVTPVLCFVGTELPWGRTQVHGVRIVGRRGLRRLVSGDGPLTGSLASRCAAEVDRVLPPA